MHRRWTALILIICALLPCVCTAEDARPRLDAAQYIVYRISDGKYRVMDFEGRFVGEDTEAFPSEKIGEAAVYMDYGRYGYAAMDGTILIEPVYLNLPRFENGYAAVQRENVDSEAVFKASGELIFPDVYGAIDAYGDIAAPIEFEEIRICEDGCYAVVSRRDGSDLLEGLFDLKQGRFAIEPRYEHLDTTHDETLIARRLIHHPEIQDSSEAYAYQYSVINAQGEELVPFQYDLIEYDEALNAYICYIDDEIAKVYEIRNGTMVEKAESPHIMMERQNKGGMKR